MRLNVSRFGILACLIGLVVAQDDGDGDRSNGETTAGAGPGTATTGSSPNEVIQVQSFSTPAVYVRGGLDQVITYNRGPGITELTVRCVNLKEYNTNRTIAQGTVNGHVPLSAGTKRYDDETIERRSILPELPFPGMLAQQKELPIVEACYILTDQNSDERYHNSSSKP